MAKIRVERGDITLCEADAIVNAANPYLRGGGGVDGAIHRAAGPTVLAECREIMGSRPPLVPGEVVATGAGRLAARLVLHAVGPIWGVESPEVQDAQLAACYRNSLLIANELGCGSVAFPNISTGVYSFPRERAASIAASTVAGELVETPSITEVVFVCFDSENERLTRLALEET